MKRINTLYSAVLLGIMGMITGTGISFGQTMSGNYTIGSSSGADFTKVTEAVDALKGASVTGDITFTIQAGVYQGVLNIDSINNGIFTIAFEGEDQDAVIIQPIGRYKTAGVYINQIDNLEFRNFTLEMDSISTKEFLVVNDSSRGFLLNRTENVIIENLRIQNSSYEAFDPGRNKESVTSSIYLDSVTNVTIQNNHFSGAGFHIKFLGFYNVEIADNYFENQHFCIADYKQQIFPSEGLFIRRNVCVGPWSISRFAIMVNGNYAGGLMPKIISNIVIEDNIIDTKGYYSSQVAISVVNAYDIEIRRNIAKNGGRAVEFFNDSLMVIESNYFNTNGSGQYAFYLSGGTKVECTNNMFMAENSTIYFADNDSLIFKYNTVRYGNGDLVFTSTQGLNVFENNIFDAFDTSSTNSWFINSPMANTMQIDYNAYTQGKTLFMHNYTHDTTYYETGYLSLSDWQAMQPYFDQHSRELVHSFVAAEDYHISNGSDYRFGDPESLVFEDYDGDSRDSVTGFDVGCDQFTEDIALFDFSAAEGFKEFCSMLGDYHEICFRSELVENPKSIFKVHSTEDDSPSDYNVYNIDYTLNGDSITVTFDVYNQYKWHEIEETYLLPNVGDSDSSNVLLTKRNTANVYTEMPFHFVVTRLGNDGIADELSSSLSPKIYRIGTSTYMISEMMKEVTVYAVDGRKISSKNNTQTINLEMFPQGVYIVRAFDKDMQPRAWRVVAY